MVSLNRSGQQVFWDSTIIEWNICFLAVRFLVIFMALENIVSYIWLVIQALSWNLHFYIKIGIIVLERGWFVSNSILSFSRYEIFINLWFCNEGQWKWVEARIKIMDSRKYLVLDHILVSNGCFIRHCTLIFLQLVIFTHQAYWKSDNYLKYSSFLILSLEFTSINDFIFHLCLSHSSAG